MGPIHYPGDAEAALWELGPLGSNYNSLAIGVFVTSHNAELNDAVLTGNMFQEFPQEPVAFVNELEGGEVYAGTDYTLSAKVSGYSPYTYVWKKDGVVLDEGKELFNSTFRYKISAATLEDSGSYTLEVSNVANGVTTTKSSTVTLSVVPDEDAPTVVGAQALNNTIGITFNEAVDQATATTVANYTVEGKTVTEVKMNSLAPERVTLVLNSAVSGSAEVTIKDVADLSGNVME